MYSCLTQWPGKSCGVEIALAVAEFPRIRKGGIPKVYWHRLVKARLRVRSRARQRHHNAVALGRFTDEYDCLRERKPRSRHVPM